ncbi:MAG: hypothetical protein ACI906_001873 [Candidatus Latescibacterota bacterium]|jgi:hypothetical protein
MPTVGSVVIGPAIPSNWNHSMPTVRAAMTETYHVMVSPHNPNGPISTVASLHRERP